MPQQLCRVAFLVCCALGFSAASAAAQSEPVAFSGATIYPVSGPPVESGVLILQNGKISYVGTGDNIRLARTAMGHDATGKVIIPGLVDTHSHVGLYAKPRIPANADGNESTAPTTPDVRALDSIWPADPGIRMALAGGVTTANIMPGSGNVVGGQTAYVKYRGRTVEDMLIKDETGAFVLGGMKMANGENPKNTHRGKAGPMTRMGVAAHQRKLFIEAQAYKKKWDTYREKIAAGPASV